MAFRRPNQNASLKGKCKNRKKSLRMPSGDLIPGGCCTVARALFLQDLTCFTAEQQREARRGKGSDMGSRVKRKLKNRTKNSICSGLDGSFCSLESSALNPICASCQLCPMSLVGTEKKKLQMADKHGVCEVRTWLTLVGMARFFFSWWLTQI